MELYKSSIIAIQEYFGVSESCANYLYYRAFRSKRRDSKYLKWDIKLQNALVKLDKSIGLIWANVKFGEEKTILAEYMIDLNEFDNKVFRWVDETTDKNTLDSEWTTVVNKKKIKRENPNIFKLIKRPGLYF